MEDKKVIGAEAEREELLLQTIRESKTNGQSSISNGTTDMAGSVGAQKLPQFIAAAAVNIAAIAAGIALGWPSPSLAKLKDLDETPLGAVINTEQESWIGSLVALGAAIGPFPAGIGCDKMGRKLTLLISTAPFIVAWFMISTTCNVTQIYAARFLMGAGVGAIFTALPMYIGEISEDSIRGALGSFMQLFITVGLLLAYAIGPYVSFFWFSVICFIIPVVFAIVFTMFPESPAFLIAAGRKPEAKEALRKLRGLQGEALNKEISVIQESVEEAMRNKGSFMDIIKNKGNFKALLLSLGLVTGQQLSGINVVLFYTENIFTATGSTIPAAISAIIIGIVQVLSSALTPMIVERLGRKLLLLISAAGMVLSLIVLGLYFYLSNNGTDVSGISFLPVLCLVAYMIVYCIGFGPLPWAVMGELFPANIKSIASTATASFCWLIGFLMTKFFSNIAEVIGMSGAFWIFAGFTILSGVFVFMFLPETKGKSLQEIQDELNGIK
ncbi:uncharacterized protein CBL_10180 [Carabus blaptoides fortunei]